MNSAGEAVILSIAGPLLMAVVAIGVLLFIKISRRRQSRPQSHDALVPVTPMSTAQARRLTRGYLLVLALIVVGFCITLAVMAEAVGSARLG